MASSGGTERARRLLVLIGTLKRDARIPLGELASMLDVSVSELSADLELLSVCGVAPYGPEDLVPVFVDGDSVQVFGALPALERRVRLSAAEARALAAVLQIAGRSDSDPLVRRLLEATSEVDPAEIERVLRTTASEEFATTATLTLGAARHECVAIAYLAAGSAEASERVVEPMALFNERGAWYVEAYCRRAGALRTFRVDRIRSAEPTGESFVPRGLTLAATAVPRGTLPLAQIRLAQGVAVPERQWPGVRVVSADEEGTLVELPYAGTGWIARQVVSLLGDATVTGPAEVRAAVAELAASELDRLG